MQGIATKYMIKILLGTHHSQKSKEGAQNLYPILAFPPVHENPRIYF